MHRSVRKKSLYTGDTSDTNLYLPNQVTQPIVHVLDEWAKVARNAIRIFPLRLAQQDDRIRLFLPDAESRLTEWFHGAFCPGGLIGRSNGDLGGANLCPHSLSSLRRLGLGRTPQTT